MLAFGFKAVWFSLSLTGFLSSVAALPAFAQALDGYLIPGLYTATNFVLQGFFCLGMIWKMDPFEIPGAFCIVQPALSGVAWSFMTVITSCMTFATSYAIFRPAGGVPASPVYIRSRLGWHPACLIMAFIPMAAFAAYLVLALKFDAVQPVDGLNCDATNPVWVRLLSYAGVPLLLALPSLLLTCAAAFQFYVHSPRPPRRSRSFVPSNDHFTPVPLRRQSKFRLNNGWHEAKGVDVEPYTTGSMPELTPSSTGPSADQRSVTPSGTIVVAEAIPSPPDSLSSARARMSTGRAPISPGCAKPGMRYHLPFQWQPPSPRSSSDIFRESPELTYSRQTPSPLVFAMPADDAGKGPNTTMVSVTSELSDRIYDAAPWLKDEKAYLRQIERANNARKHETTHDDDENYDAVSGSLRWIRNSDDTASTAKSELEFARTPQREAFEEVAWRPSPVDPSTYDAGLTETPIPNFTRMVWRILFFQLFSSATQIVATLSSLIDMFTQNAHPSPFGTHHVALILAAWAPSIAFGIIPWRRKAR
ncbi:hypothetical protein C8T65DRAFT_574982 [Cerioporus squamosus]|nr:hypothetical protein C8T65DRAFT_574982 [Cerioporus squamosus]